MFDWTSADEGSAKGAAIREAIAVLEDQLLKLDANNCLLSAARLSHALDALRSELGSAIS